MTFPSHLQAVARSAYRQVIRSARITFHEDPVRHAALLSALRTTFSSPSLTAPVTTNATPPVSPIASAETISEAELRQRIDDWKDVALFLRRNVVQGRLDEQSGSFKLRVTKYTEIGDNSSIKTPPKLPTTPFPNRGKQRSACRP